MPKNKASIDAFILICYCAGMVFAIRHCKDNENYSIFSYRGCFFIAFSVDVPVGFIVSNERSIDVVIVVTLDFVTASARAMAWMPQRTCLRNHHSNLRRDICWYVLNVKPKHIGV